MLHFDSNDAVSIKESQTLLNEISMEPNLTLIHSNYGFLPSTITKLESQGVSLTDSVSTVMFTKNKSEEVAGDVEMKVNTKFNQVLEKNDRVCNNIKNLNGESSSMNGLPEDLMGNDVTFYKYAPVTSTDVERSFSRYKTILAVNWRSFDVENIKKTLVVQCNNLSDKPKFRD
ncbi:uncharacterized protein LOC112693715 [Sipha flava]|uniref:Uncharacterized protein LOC112693715 n=1 Tax=Sipha flava TaxID=143950 RepID=A0A8B8GNW2_9HEMI|nr:uncharacterized protein LOC112693715 [Sipha flava]